MNYELECVEVVNNSITMIEAALSILPHPSFEEIKGQKATLVILAICKYMWEKIWYYINQEIYTRRACCHEAS